MRVAIAVAALLLAGGPPVREALAQGTWQQTEFVIGTGNDPVTTANPEETLRSVQFAKNAYFNLLTATVAHTDDDHWIVFRNHPSWNAAKLDAAAKLGLKMFLANSAYTGALASDVPPPMGSWNPALTREVFDAYNATTADPARNDALWGYFLFDEPGPQANTAPWLKAWIDSIHGDDRRFGGTHRRAAFLNFTPGDTATMNAIANDPDPDKRLDVASLDLYPFGPEPGKPCPNQRWGYFAAQRRLKAIMGARPYWVVALAAPALFGSASTNFCDPDASQLRFMAFGAAASGAKGILWMGYRASYEYDSLPNPTYVMGDVDKPNCRYGMLREINHYLHDVVGPVVMQHAHAGLFHQANGPHPEDPASMPLVSGAPAADCPATSLGNDNLAVGVFQPAGAPGEYYLLVINKALTAQSGTVQLRASYAVAAAPSVVGYVGGDGLSPLAEGASFPVSLAGGEGRLYHLTPAPVGHVRLTSPAGGETWLPGESHTVTWQPASAAVDITLLTDLRDTGTSLAGPAISIATDATGGSYTFTMPDVVSRRAHLVLTAQGSVTHAAPLLTAPATTGGESASWVFGVAQCAANGALAIGSSGYPTVAYQTAPGRLEYRSFSGSAWSPPTATAVEPGHEHWLDGYATSLAIAPGGKIHLAASAGGLQLSANARTVRHYFRTAQAETLEQVGAIAGSSDLAIATTPGGEVVIAGADSAGLVVRHRGANGWETWGSPVLLPDIRDVSVAVDAAEHAWVAFTAAGAGGKRVLAVYQVTPSLSTSALLAPGTWGQVSLALDRAGRPAFACTGRASGGDLLYWCVYDGTKWGPLEVVDARRAAITSIAIAFNGTTPGIAYLANHVARHAARDGARWTVETVFEGDAAGPVRLAYSPANGDRWVMFFDRGADGMRVVGRPVSSGGTCASCPAAAQFAVALRSGNPARAGAPLELELRLPRPATMALALFDVAGRKVAALPARRYPAGECRLAWAPCVAAPGAYFLRAERDGEPVYRRRLVLLR